MTKRIFCKIIELEEHQVLVTKEYGDEDDTYKLSQTVQFPDATPTISIGFKSEDSRDRYFEEYSVKQAEGFLSSVLEFLKEE